MLAVRAIVAIAGIGLISYGFYAIYNPLGFISAGIFLSMFCAHLDKPQ